MKTLLTAMMATLGWVAPALAAEGGIAKGTSILVILFLGFAALIIVFQFVPGLVLFFSMLKGLFSSLHKKVPVNQEKKP